MATTGDGWMSVTLVFGGVLCYASILPLGARVIYILHYGTDGTFIIISKTCDRRRYMKLILFLWLLSPWGHRGSSDEAGKERW